MNIFLAWSGPRSKAIATALHGWLPTIIQASKPWMSDLDVDKGRRWEPDIADKLSETDFGIVCLTPDNLSSTYIHFEAGAVAKALDKSRLWTFLYELSPADVKQPLGAFQHTKFTKEEVRKLLASINNQIPNPIPEKTLDKIYDSLWPIFQKEMKNVPKPSSPKKAERADRELLEEILDSIRKLSRISEPPIEQLKSSDSEVMMKTFDSLMTEVDMIFDSYLRAMDEWNTSGAHFGFESSEQIKEVYSNRITDKLIKCNSIFRELRKFVSIKERRLRQFKIKKAEVMLGKINAT